MPYISSEIEKPRKGNWKALAVQTSSEVCMARLELLLKPLLSSHEPKGRFESLRTPHPRLRMEGQALLDLV